MSHGKHRRHWTTPESYRASRLIEQPTWPSRGFCGFVCSVTALLVTLSALCGAVRVVPEDIASPVAFVSSETPVVAHMGGECR